MFSKIPLLLALAAISSSVQASTRKIANLGPHSKYLAYYGTWNEAAVAAAHQVRLVITKLDGETLPSPDVVQRIQAGRDGFKGTRDDVVVIAYLTIGEHDVNHQPIVGNGQGPTRFDKKGNIAGLENKGIASFYLDACTPVPGADPKREADGKPDENGIWGSYFVNPADPEWRKILKAEADRLLVTLGADGLFLDTLDSAEQGKSACYPGLIAGMTDTIKWLYELYTTKYLVANRGFFLLENGPHNMRPYISAIMAENQYVEWEYEQKFAFRTPYSWEYATKLMNEQSQKADGFQVLILDYVNPFQKPRLRGKPDPAIGDDKAWAKWIDGDPDPVDVKSCAELVAWQAARVAADGQGKWMNFMTPSIDLDSTGFQGCQ
jgi:hypothetical protein